MTLNLFYNSHNPRVFRIAILVAAFILPGIGGYIDDTGHDAKVVKAEEIQQAIALSGSYLNRNCETDGKFVYRMNLNPTVIIEPHYNMLRHAGTIYALTMYEKVSPNQETRETLKRAAQFLKQTIRPLPEHSDSLAVWSLPEITGSESPDQLKLGGTGLGLVALVSVEQILPGTTSLVDLRKLGQFLVSMQKADGGFYSKYFPEDGGKNDDWVSLYYPGEAALGLLLLYERDPDPLWLQTAIKAIVHLAQQRANQDIVEADHWMLLATAKLLALTDENQSSFPLETILRHAVQICESILIQRYPFPEDALEHGCFPYDGRTTPTATRLEGLLIALTFLPPEYDVLRKRITTVVHHGIAFLLRSQIREGTYSGGIPRAIRLLPPTHLRFSPSFNNQATEIRIDYVQHALSAMIQYQQMFLE